MGYNSLTMLPLAFQDGRPPTAGAQPRKGGDRARARPGQELLRLRRRLQARRGGGVLGHRQEVPEGPLGDMVSPSRRTAFLGPFLLRKNQLQETFYAEK